MKDLGVSPLQVEISCEQSEVLKALPFPSDGKFTSPAATLQPTLILPDSQIRFADWKKEKELFKKNPQMGKIVSSPNPDDFKDYQAVYREQTGIDIVQIGERFSLGGKSYILIASKDVEKSDSSLQYFLNEIEKIRQPSKVSHLAGDH